MEYSAALPALTAQPALWLLVALPLLAALGAVSRPAAARALGLLGPALVLGGALALGAPLLLRPEAQALATFAPALQLGPLDVGWTLVLDLPAAAWTVALATLALGWRWARHAPGHDAEVAPLLLALSGAVLAALADPLPLVLVGTTLAGLGAVGLGARPTPLAALGDALVLGAALVASWSVLGGFTPERELAPGLTPRLHVVHAAAPALIGEPDARLTLLAPAGARVELGGAPLCAVGPDGHTPGGVAVAGTRCHVEATAPFVALPVPAALQELRVTAGDGVGGLLAERVRLEPGQRALILVASATLSVRELGLFAALRDEHGRFPARAEWPTRRLGTLPLLELAALLAALGTLLRLGLLRPRDDGVVPLAGAPLAFTAALPALLAARVAPLFAAGSSGQALLAGGAAGLSVVGALGALARPEPHLRRAHLGLATSAALVAGLAGGAHGEAVVGAAVLALVLGAGALGADADAAPARASHLPLVLLALPVVGLGAAREGAAWGTLGLGAALGGAVTALLLLSLGLSGAAVGRQSRGAPLLGARPSAPTLLALGAALAVGALAAAPAALGLDAPSLVERAGAWTRTTLALGADAGTWLSRPALAALGAAVGLGGLLVGRREAP